MALSQSYANISSSLENPVFETFTRTPAMQIEKKRKAEEDPEEISSDDDSDEEKLIYQMVADAIDEILPLAVEKAVAEVFKKQALQQKDLGWSCSQADYLGTRPGSRVFPRSG